MVAGSYLHGMFDRPESTNAILQWVGLPSANAVDLDELREQQLERLADCIELHFDTPFLNGLNEGLHNKSVSVC